MLFKLDVKNIILIIVGLTNIIYGLIVYSRNKKNKTNLWFSFVILPITFWIISMIAYRGFQEIWLVVLSAKILYFSAAAIPFFFLYFSFIFPEEKFYFKNWQKYLLPIPFLFISAISLLPNLLIEGANIIPGEENELIYNLNFHILYALYIVGYFSWSYINLFRRYFKAGGILKVQLTYVITGTLLSTIIGVATNLILPMLGIFILNWLGQIMVIIMVTLISYAILKYHLFNIQVIAAELLVFIIWIFVFIRLFFSSTFQDWIINGLLLAFLTISGVMLIRSILKEVQQREKIQELSTYKTELISVIAHQIKNPLTVIKDYSSLIEDKTINDISKIREVILKIKLSTNKLIDLLNNLLDLGHIEDGKIHYGFEKIELNKVLKEVIDDFQFNAQQKGLNLTFEPAPQEVYVNGDIYKLSQAFRNLVDNAIKYTEIGGVKVKICDNYGDDKKFILVEISDSGIGMSKDLLDNLFQRFVRGVAEKQVLGSGLGLYISKKIVDDHQGEVWAESEGEGKGSKFFVSLPKIS